jgi:hypothetical protein
MPDST